LAILTAVTVIAMTVVQNTLQPELAAAHKAPLFRSAALYLVLISVGLAALERLKLVRPQVLLDAGMLFEVAGAIVIGIMENTPAWPLDYPVRGASGVTAWIAVCALVIPNRPWKSFTAAMLSATMVPAAHSLSAQVLGYPPLPWNRLAALMLSAVFMAGWTLFLSTRIYRMETDRHRGAVARLPCHTTVHTGPYTAVRLVSLAVSD
jgi:hypothetical protein